MLLLVPRTTTCLKCTINLFATGNHNDPHECSGDGGVTLVSNLRIPSLDTTVTPLFVGSSCGRFTGARFKRVISPVPVHAVQQASLEPRMITFCGVEGWVQCVQSSVTTFGPTQPDSGTFTGTRSAVPVHRTRSAVAFHRCPLTGSLSPVCSRLVLSPA